MKKLFESWRRFMVEGEVIPFPKTKTIRNVAMEKFQDLFAMDPIDDDEEVQELFDLLDQGVPFEDALYKQGFGKFYNPDDSGAFQTMGADQEYEVKEWYKKYWLDPTSDVERPTLVKEKST